MAQQTMKALVKREAAKGIWLEEVPVPTPGPNEVLIKLEKTAICGTDLHIYLWDEWSQRTIKPGLTIGHEFVGRIAALGSAVTGYEIGQRVSAEGHIVCGHCRNCRGGRPHLCPNTVGIGVNVNGAFAEYMVMPASNLWPIPDQIPSELAAFFDPYGNAAHCALEFNVIGEDVLITGAGPIGIIAAGICKHIGARNVVVTDVNDFRLKLAADMGATRVVNVANQSLKDVMKELHMEGFDVGLEMSGNPRAFNEHARLHVPRRQDRHARHHAQGRRLRLGQDHLQGPDRAGHLRPQDVRDLVQDDPAGAVRLPARQGDDPPAADR